MAMRIARTAPILMGLCACTSATTISGGAQKGPFVIGSTVEVVALSRAAEPTGRVFHTTTRDDLGTFSLSVGAASSAVEIVAEGFYFNEVTGGLADAPLTLRSFVGLGDGGTHESVVNPITHLASRRAAHLYADGAQVAQAIEQAEAEVRATLGLVEPDDLPAGEALDLLGGDSAANAYLLAVGCLFAQAAENEVSGTESSASARLQEILNTIAIDLEFDGVLDAPRVAWIESGLRSLDGRGCMANLGARFAALGRDDLEVPDVFLVTDFDGDGVPDALDPDADGDGILAVDEALVDGAAMSWSGFGGGGAFEHRSVVAIDNRQGDDGGQAWALDVLDTQLGVRRIAPHRIESAPGEPLTGLVAVASFDSSLPYLLLHESGALWTWAPGQLAVLDTDAPSDITGIRPVAEDRILVQTGTDAWHEVWPDGFGAVEWASLPAASGRRLFSFDIDGEAVWLVSDDVWVDHYEWSAPVLVGPMDEDIVDALMIGGTAVFLGESGVVRRIGLDVSGPSSVVALDEPDDVLRIAKRAGGMAYMNTATQVWDAQSPSAPAPIDAGLPVVFGAGRVMRGDFPHHVLLGADANVHFAHWTGEGETHTVVVPK